MNEKTKTSIFAGIAVGLCLLAFFTETPNSIDVEDQAQQRKGEDLFAEFTDPLTVANLRIVKYNEDLGELSQFEVLKDTKSGVWTLPSADSYPADAEAQLGKAANSLIGVKILEYVSSRPDDQSLYGVAEPNANKIEVGQSGFGQLVRMQDEKGERLAELIIGKEVKGQPTQRYVRIPTNDQIYIAEVDPSVFTTDFKKWINQDLLQLSSTDVRKLEIRDYDIVPTARGAALSRQFDAVAAFNTADGKWSAEKIVEYNGPNQVDRPLGEGETLDATKLNAIKTALDSLQIEGVNRKPQGLAADLKADATLLDDESSIRSLQARGFYPQPTPSGQTELFASSGELLATLEGGVQYLLRFGNTTQTGAEGAEPAEGEAVVEDAIASNRYLLVTAKLDESQFPPPQLDTVPQTVEEMEAAEEAAKAPQNVTPAAPQQGEPAAEQPQQDAAQEPTADPPQSPENAADPAAEESAAEGDAPGSEPAAEDEAAAEGEAAPAVEEATAQPQPADQSRAGGQSFSRFVALQAEETQQPAAVADEAGEQAPEAPAQAAADAQGADDAQGAPAAPAEAEETPEEKQERLEALQERITKANQRKIDERNDGLEQARKRVAELNARFAEWYYVISESQYEKLNISLEDLIQQPGEAAAGGIPAPPQGFDPSSFGGFGG